MKSIAIVQSNYIPWKGYFDLISRVDEFVLYDDMQYTRRDWRNRNKIKTPQGLKWLTIPVEVKGKYYQSIRQTKIVDKTWAEGHFESIRQNYRKAAYFQDCSDWLRSLYEKAAALDFLSDVNFLFLSEINSRLGIRTRLRWSSEFEVIGEKSERLASICEQAGGDCYVSGPAARDYLDSASFIARGIGVEWMDYSDYPEYRQLFAPFDHHVTVLDLILNEGGNADQFLKYTGNNSE